MLDRAVNQEMHLCKQAEERRKQVDVRQLYNQVPQTVWVSSRSSCSWSQLGTRWPRENQRQTEGFGPSVTHGWPRQPRCERSAAMIRRTLGQYVAVWPRLQLTYHTQPTSTLSRIMWVRCIFIKKCVRSFIEVRHYCWLCFRLYLYMYTCIMSIQHISAEEKDRHQRDIKSSDGEVVALEIWRMWSSSS